MYALELSRSGTNTTTPDLWGKNNTLVIRTSSSVSVILINSKDVKSYYGLFILDIKNITNQLLKNLELIIRENKISLFEKSLINFMFSKLAKKNDNLKEEINFLKLAHQNCYNSNITFNSQSDFYYN